MSSAARPRTTNARSSAEFRGPYKASPAASTLLGPSRGSESRSAQSLLAWRRLCLSSACRSPSLPQILASSPGTARLIPVPGPGSLLLSCSLRRAFRLRCGVVLSSDDCSVAQRYTCRRVPCQTAFTSERGAGKGEAGLGFDAACAPLGGSCSSRGSPGTGPSLRVNHVCPRRAAGPECMARDWEAFSNVRFPVRPKAETQCGDRPSSGGRTDPAPRALCRRPQLPPQRFVLPPARPQPKGNRLPLTLPREVGGGLFSHLLVNNSSTR